MALNHAARNSTSYDSIDNARFVPEAMLAERGFRKEQAGCMRGSGQLAVGSEQLAVGSGQCAGGSGQSAQPKRPGGVWSLEFGSV